MASLVSGYEYDIFISYRQNDNRYDHWVTEFVANLTAELEATLKGKVNIYFDENPTDGLLESHNVDASLSPKLHALILIPIVSQTYCDPESFAWNQEFTAFLQFVSHDKFGLMVKLSGGNASNRILPIRIHELDAADISLFEDAAGIKFRPIDFIYKEPGVNRPLRANEESPTKNLNQTLYRNQINKVANAVKEILQGLRNAEGGVAGSLFEKQTEPEKGVRRKVSASGKTIFVASLIAMILLLYFTYQFLKSRDTESKIELAVLDKSIAVIPFVDMSIGHDQEYFADGMMDEILDRLYKIGDLRVPSRTTCMKYRNTKLSAPEIARELGVAHILEGSIRKDGDMVRITVQLIDGEKDQHEWSEEYNRPLMVNQLLTVQSDVAQQVARILKAKINPAVKRSIEHISTENTSAYELYLKLKPIRWQIPSDSLKKLLDEILALDPNFAPALVELASYWTMNRGTDDLPREQVIENAMPLFNRALELDSSLVSTHGYLARFHFCYDWDFSAADREFNNVMKLNPNAPLGPGYYNYQFAMGRNLRALQQIQKSFSIDNNYPWVWHYLAYSYFKNDRCDEALKTVVLAGERFPEDKQGLEDEKWEINLKCAKDLEVQREAREYFGKKFEQAYLNVDDKTYTGHLCEMAVFFFKNGQPQKTNLLLEKLIVLSKRSPVRSPSFYTARVYSVMGKRALALQYLEKAYADREIEMYWVKSAEEFNSLHNDSRWKELIRKMNFPSI